MTENSTQERIESRFVTLGMLSRHLDVFYKAVLELVQLQNQYRELLQIMQEKGVLTEGDIDRIEAASDLADVSRSLPEGSDAAFQADMQEAFSLSHYASSQQSVTLLLNLLISLYHELKRAGIVAELEDGANLTRFLIENKG